MGFNSGFKGLKSLGAFGKFLNATKFRHVPPSICLSAWNSLASI